MKKTEYKKMKQLQGTFLRQCTELIEEQISPNAFYSNHVITKENVVKVCWKQNLTQEEFDTGWIDVRDCDFFDDE